MHLTLSPYRPSCRVLIAALLVITGLLTLTPAADAAGGEHGTLLVKGPGSVYAADGGVVFQTVAAGTATSFGFEVKNTGASTAQFNVRITQSSQTAAAVAVSAGSLVVTPVAMGPNGYYTAPIAPGKVAVYTLKVTPTKGTVNPGDELVFSIELDDTAGTGVGYGFAVVTVTNIIGTTSADQFINTSGTPSTTGNPDYYPAVSAPSVAPGKSFTFTDKLKNDSPLATPIGFQLEQYECSDFFPIKVTVGSTVVTQSVLDGTYETKPLAKGASVSLTITINYLDGGADCLLGRYYSDAYNIWTGYATSVFDSSRAAFYFTPAA